MKPLRQTLKWMVILLLAGLVSGGGYAYWLWTRSEDMLRGMVLDKLAELQPHWNVTLGRARFDWHRRVHLNDVVLAAEGQGAPILRLSELVLTVDHRALADDGRLVIQRIRVVEPEVTLVRDPRGRWNWRKLLPLPRTGDMCPEWLIEDGRLHVRIQRPDGTGPTTLSTAVHDLQLVPSGKRQYAVRAEAGLERGGRLRLDGRWNLDAATWMVNGWIDGATADNSMLHRLAELSPHLRSRFARLNARLARLQSGPKRGPAPEAGPPFPDGFRLQADLDVNFRIARRDPGGDPELQSLVTVRQGQLDHPALPFPLRNLRGKFYWDPRQFVLRDVRAQNGVTRVALDGRINRRSGADPGGVHLQLTDLALDDRFARSLPPEWRRLYDVVQPSGPVDVKGRLLYRGSNQWTPREFVLTAKGCTGTHTAFPYPVHDIVGTIRQHGQELEMQLHGRMGQQHATLRGRVVNPGPRAEALYEIRVRGLPLDKTFRAACRPPVRETIDSLNLRQAVADAVCRLYRPPGLDRDYRIQIAGDVRRAEIKAEAFPYRLSNMSGRITFSSQTELWTFENLQAAHGPARLTGSATFTKTDETRPGRLELKVTSRNVSLDGELRHALPESLRSLWSELSPGGTLDQAVTELDWTPGTAPVVAIPEASVRDGSLDIRAFPYSLDDVDTRFSYEPQNDLVRITSFSAKHGETAVTARGEVHLSEAGGWTLEIRDLHVDDLVPDRIFRRALPGDLRRVVEKLDPHGSLSLAGRMAFQVPRAPETPLTANWNLELICSGGSVAAGVRLEDVQGKVTTRGTWNGRQSDVNGRITLDSVTLWGKQFTRLQGPYEVNGHQVVIGTADAMARRSAPRSRSDVPLAEQLTARAIGGTFSLNAIVSLLQENQPVYDVQILMRDARLERYAGRYLPGTNNIRGAMDGWLVLHGRGDAAEDINGRGRVQISPAALYELPVIVGIFKVLNLAPPDRTAFTYAFFDFDVAEGRFRFNQIVLDGDAVRLGGRGTARFNGQLDLEFGARLPASRVPIPLVNYVIGQASQGWVGIDVQGPLANPNVAYRAAPVLDETMKEILRSLEARSAGAIRQLVPPGMRPRRPNRPGMKARP